MKLDQSYVVDEGGRVILLGSRSKATGKGIFPRVPSASPVASLYEALDVAGPGILYSYTVIHPNPKTGQQPFVLAYVDFAQDARIFARLECASAAVHIGMAVEAKTMDPPDSGIVFVPSQEN